VHLPHVDRGVRNGGDLPGRALCHAAAATHLR
jgi:hypothetical protein